MGSRPRHLGGANFVTGLSLLDGIRFRPRRGPRRRWDLALTYAETVARRETSAFKNPGYEEDRGCSDWSASGASGVVSVALAQEVAVSPRERRVEGPVGANEADAWGVAWAGMFRGELILEARPSGTPESHHATCPLEQQDPLRLGAAPKIGSKAALAEESKRLMSSRVAPPHMWRRCLETCEDVGTDGLCTPFSLPQKQPVRLGVDAADVDLVIVIPPPANLMDREREVRSLPDRLSCNPFIGPTHHHGKRFPEPLDRRAPVPEFKV